MANSSEPVSVPAVKPADNPADSASTNTNKAPAASASADSWYNNPAKLGMVIGGSLLSIVGGVYGYQSIGKGTPRAVAQQSPTTAEVAKSEPTKVLEPPKLPENILDLPPIESPRTRQEKLPPKPLIDDLPDVTAPPIPKLKPVNSDLVIEAPKVSPPKNDIVVEAPKINRDLIIEPPAMNSVNTNRVTNPDQNMPIIRVGAEIKSDTAPPPMITPPKAPVIDIDPLPVVSPPTVGAPMITTPEVKAPTVTTPMITTPMINTPPVTAPGNTPLPPLKADVDIPPPPVITAPPKTPTAKDDLPLIKVPMTSEPTISAPPPTPIGEPKIKAPGTDVGLPTPPSVPTIDIKPVPPAPSPAPMIDVRPMVPSIDVRPAPMIDVRPEPMVAKPPVEPAKRETFDEDWHTPRSGDTYAMISKEYYKTADYAQALEAYNKDKLKSGEKIIRVPPIWVLEEKFPNLTGPGKTDPQPNPANKSTGISYDSVDTKTIGSSNGNSSGASRPAPPPVITPASNQNDEYRVQAESGETIREIARKLYGDANAWRRIWDMNPKVDPTQPIPVGTTLRLPK